MRSHRGPSRKALPTLTFEMLVLVWLLSFPREITGATFFRQYDSNGNHTLSCNRPEAESETEYLWCKGSGSSSLQEFKPIENDLKKNSAPQCRGHSPCYRNKTLPMCVSSHGGIFACTALTEHRACPLFTDIKNCSDFDFFIVAIRDDAEEKKAFGMIKDPSENVTTIPEKGNFTLTCGLQIKPSSIELTLYWIKETVPSLCLFSASNEGSHGGYFSEDANCCVDADIKKRRAAPPVKFSGGWLNHSLTIVNASPSDSGKYVCVVTIWRNKHLWKIASNVSIEVQNSTLSREFTAAYRFAKQLQISLGVIVSVIPVCGIIWLLCWKKKAKGNPAAEGPRNRMEIELEADDCSPYAVSSRNDIDKDEALYSVVMKPPGTVSTLSDAKPASQPGEKLQTVYALVSK